MTTVVVASLLLLLLSWFAYRAVQQYLPAGFHSIVAAMLIALTLGAFLEIPNYVPIVSITLALITAACNNAMARNYLRVKSGRKKGIGLLLQSAGLIVLVVPLTVASTFSPWTVYTAIAASLISASVFVQRQS